MTDLNILDFPGGAGLPVFLIHGYTGDAKRWVLVEDALTAQHPLTAVEMPGHGDSPKRVPESFEALASEVIAAFDARGFSQAHIVGHSLGGAVAMALAEARPEICASLSLLAPAGLGPSAAGETLKGLATAAAPEDLRRFYECLVHDPALVTDEWVELAVEIRADPKLRAAQDALGEVLFPDGALTFDMVPVLQKLGLPTQILWGRQDQILPWEGALRAPPQVALHLFPEMGHIPQLEEPDQTAQLLLRHFRAAELLA